MLYLRPRNFENSAPKGRNAQIFCVFARGGARAKQAPANSVCERRQPAPASAATRWCEAEEPAKSLEGVEKHGPDLGAVHDLLEDD